MNELATAPSDRFAATSPVNGGGTRSNILHAPSSPACGGSVGGADEGGIASKLAGHAHINYSVQGLLQ